MLAISSLVSLPGGGAARGQSDTRKKIPSSSAYLLGSSIFSALLYVVRLCSRQHNPIWEDRMSSPSEYNDSYVEYYMYWAGFVHNDPTTYPDSLRGMCTSYYDEDSQLYDCKDWIPQYPRPSPADLMAFTLDVVHSYYNDKYLAPRAISAAQFYQISTAALSRVRTNPEMIGYRVFDTDARTEKRWDGNTWVSASWDAL